MISSDSRPRLFVMVGFLISLVSIIVGTLVVSKIDSKQGDVIKKINQLKETRMISNEFHLWSSLKIDFAHTLFASVQQLPSTLQNTQEELLKTSRSAIELAIRTDLSAIDQLSEAKPYSSIPEQKDLSEELKKLLDIFYSNNRGVPGAYDEFRAIREDQRAQWVDENKQLFSDLSELEEERRQLDSNADYARFIAVGFQILGLMLVLIKDLPRKTKSNVAI